MVRRHVYPFGWALCLLAAVLFANALAEESSLRIEIEKHPDRLRIVHAEVRIPAPSGVVWSVVTDYDGLARFVPHIEKSRLTGEQPDGSKLVEQIKRSRFLFYRKRMRLVMRILEDSKSRVVFTAIFADFAEYQGMWDIDALPDVTRLRLSLRLKPAFFAPGFVLNRIVRSTAEKSLRAI